jgi:lysozyme
MRRRRWQLAWAARFVARWEGFLGSAYLDTIASPAVWTIGYGHTGPDVHPGQRISRARALTLLARDLRFAARAVARSIHVPLTARQRIALISLAFNCGPGAVDGSTLQRELNARRYRRAADCFLDWSHAGGVVVEGLLNRRKEERWMFLNSNRKAHR